MPTMSSGSLYVSPGAERVAAGNARRPLGRYDGDDLRDGSLRERKCAPCDRLQLPQIAAAATAPYGVLPSRYPASGSYAVRGDSSAAKSPPTPGPTSWPAISSPIIRTRRCAPPAAGRYRDIVMIEWTASSPSARRRAKRSPKNCRRDGLAGCRRDDYPGSCGRRTQCRRGAGR